MDTEKFRCHVHVFVDWTADYLARAERCYPVRDPVKLCQGPRGNPLGRDGLSVFRSMGHD
jgi:hypothetical protein